MRLPSSRHKHYLTGIDWVVNTFCRMTEGATGAGNQSQLVLELGGALDAARLQGELDEFSRRMPIAFGRTGRDWNLAPFWRYPTGRVRTAIRLETHDLGPQATPAEVRRALAAPVNTALRGPNEHVVCRYVTGGGRNWFVLVFDHRLLDARGAEAFLALIQQWCLGHDKALLQRAVPSPEPAHLSDWREKFKAGQRASRFLTAMSQADLRYLPLPERTRAREFHFETLPLDETDSRRILDAAFEGAGYLMLMPFVLAAVCRGMHRAFDARGLARSEYVVPVTVDMRPAEHAAERVFFNQLSFFMFKVGRADVEDRDRLFRALRRQLYDQVKAGTAADLCAASMLMRIAPLGLARRLVRIPLQGRMGSFCFAYVGDTAYPFRALLETPVLNLYHMPRVPLPPGLGFFFSNYHGRLNGVLSYLDGVLDEAEAQGIVAGVREVLL